MNAAELLAQDHPAHGPLGWAERRLLPDALVRLGIRRLCAQRLRQERAGDAQAQALRAAQRLRALSGGPIAQHTAAANAQHYELPAPFFESCLGRRLKYSSAYFARGDETLDAAEEAMLALYGERAQLRDGQEILELGCGWGSLTLWMAERYPAARITAVTNSSVQRDYLAQRCRERQHSNVRVLRSDINELELPAALFDRCVSVEMFEHLSNYRELLARISAWLRPAGKLFAHVFAHRSLLYPFEVEGADNWLGRHFFTGGLMPAADTLLQFTEHLRIERRWQLSGMHYRRTAEAWLRNHDEHREDIMQLFVAAYGAQHAALWFQRWRMFWMACAELFGYAGGREWIVAHYRFSQATGATARR